MININRRQIDDLKFLEEVAVEVSNFFSIVKYTFHSLSNFRPGSNIRDEILFAQMEWFSPGMPKVVSS